VSVAPGPAWGSKDQMEAALRARDEVYRLVPRRWWWPWSTRRMTTLHAVEVYVQEVLRAYGKGLVQGWPPGTVDHALQPRRRRAARRPRTSAAG
jgi:hypothetical protein